MAIKPIEDRVVVKISEAEKKSAGGIFLPENAQEKPQQGTVIAVGQGKLLQNGNRVTPSLKVGDVILFGKYAGNDIKLDGVEHKILRESEVLGKIVS